MAYAGAKTPTSLTPNPCNAGAIKRAEISIAAADGTGSFEIVTAVTAKTLVVLELVVTADADTSIGIKQGSTVVSGPQKRLAGDAYSLPYSEKGHGETASGAALNLTLTVAANVGGHVVYVEM